MKFIKKYEVKQILTENSKRLLEESIGQEKRTVLKEIEQLEFERRRLQKQRPDRKEWINKRFESELNNREEKLSYIEFRLTQLQQLPIGSEIAEGEVEAIHEADAGDRWDDLHKKGKILIKDGIIQSIL
ncbi:YlqD family protein [Pseudalkalibacillus caeni]|nr:YlqD family protein [Pseudalkalibacillus caeni]